MTVGDISGGLFCDRFWLHCFLGQGQIPAPAKARSLGAWYVPGSKKAKTRRKLSSRVVSDCYKGPDRAKVYGSGFPSELRVLSSTLAQAVPRTAKTKDVLGTCRNTRWGRGERFREIVIVPGGFWSVAILAQALERPVCDGRAPLEWHGRLAHQWPTLTSGGGVGGARRHGELPNGALRHRPRGLLLASAVFSTRSGRRLQRLACRVDASG